MRSETGAESRQIGRPNTIRNLISGMNSNANSNSLTAHLQHQSITQQTDEESMLHKVNLAAAFHDHISCTKAGGNISSFVAYQVNSDSNVKKFPSCDALLFGNATDDEDDDKEQISMLKNMILVQLDLIQYQQEQLLKKDRQLQGLKQDREALCLRLEKMEKRITYLTSKLANVNENSGEDTETIIDSKDSETNDSLDTFCNMFNDSSTVFQRVYSNASSTSNVCVLNTNNVLNVANNNQTSFVNIEPSSSTSQNSLVLNNEDKTSKKRSLISRECPFSMKKKNRVSKPLENEVKTNLVNVKNMSQPIQSNDKSKFSSKKRKPNGKLKKAESVVEEAIEIDKSQSLEFLTTTSPYNVVVNNVSVEDDEAAGDIELESTLIEVPSWRLHPISSCYSLEGTENLDDEVFTRRHSKLEIDERRRKRRVSKLFLITFTVRWDIQRLREQKNNERLRSGRYGGYLDKPSDNKKDEIEIFSFFPEPKDVEYIEVCDKLPFVAFGHPIPRLPERNFSLPWLSTKQRNFQKTVNS